MPRRRRKVVAETLHIKSQGPSESRPIGVRAHENHFSFKSGPAGAKVHPAGAKVHRSQGLSKPKR